MKKIISIVLVLACAFALFSCGKDDPTEVALKEINDMYHAISPSKVVTKTTEEFGEFTLIGTSVLKIGSIDGNSATTYESLTQKLRDVKSGSGNEVVSVIEDVEKQTKQYHEELGYRENGGKWDEEGEDFAPKAGDNALNLTKAIVKDFTIDEENRTYTFVVAAENTKTVFGYEIAADVSVKIIHSGADITGVVLTYTLLDEENEEYPEIKVTVDVSYSYDTETITIE